MLGIGLYRSAVRIASSIGESKASVEIFEDFERIISVYSEPVKYGILKS
jgi:hypothetical protein